MTTFIHQLLSRNI